MRCPFCNSRNTRVLDTRRSIEDVRTRRRHECNDCGERFSTVELYHTDFIKLKATRQKIDEIACILLKGV